MSAATSPMATAAQNKNSMKFPRATDHYAAQAGRSNIGIFINQKDD